MTSDSEFFISTSDFISVKEMRLSCTIYHCLNLCGLNTKHAVIHKRNYLLIFSRNLLFFNRFMGQCSWETWPVWSCSYRLFIYAIYLGITQLKSWWLWLSAQLWVSLLVSTQNFRVGQVTWLIFCIPFLWFFYMFLPLSWGGLELVVCKNFTKTSSNYIVLHWKMCFKFMSVHYILCMMFEIGWSYYYWIWAKRLESHYHSPAILHLINPSKKQTINWNIVTWPNSNTSHLFSYMKTIRICILRYPE